MSIHNKLKHNFKFGNMNASLILKWSHKTGPATMDKFSPYDLNHASSISRQRWWDQAFLAVSLESVNSDNLMHNHRGFVDKVNILNFMHSFTGSLRWSRLHNFECVVVIRKAIQQWVAVVQSRCNVVKAWIVVLRAAGD